MIDLNSESGFVYGGQATGGATSQRINALIDSALVAQNRQQRPRNYLGGSRIGDPCARKLIYEFTNTPVDAGKGFNGQTLRIFDAGHQFETLSIRWLRDRRFRPARQTAGWKAIWLLDREWAHSRTYRWCDRVRPRRWDHLARSVRT
jgi:hypothetical protein